MSICRRNTALMLAAWLVGTGLASGQAPPTDGPPAGFFGAWQGGGVPKLPHEPSILYYQQTQCGVGSRYFSYFPNYCDHYPWFPFYAPVDVSYYSAAPPVTSFGTLPGVLLHPQDGN